MDLLQYRDLTKVSDALTDREAMCWGHTLNSSESSCVHLTMEQNLFTGFPLGKKKDFEKRELQFSGQLYKLPECMNLN